MLTNTLITLAAHPQGMVKTTDMTLTSAPVTDLKEGQFLVENEFISLDPAIRGWMNPGTTYIRGIQIGEVIRTFSAGKIIESNHAEFLVGEYVWGLLGAQKYAISDGAGIVKADLSKGPLSWHLGALGMPGMTAYFGLLDKAKPQAGETVLISGAAGIVGTTVGQIAKIKGCRVVGIAGGEAKCRFLTEEIGFDAAIDYKNENVLEGIRRTCPDRINIFYDNVGGDILDDALAHLAWGARVVLCGNISQYNSTDPRGPRNYMKIVTARGYMTGVIVFDYFNRYAEGIKDISEWIAEGKFKIKEDIYEGIENFPITLLKLYSGDNFGKLLLKI
ncbi:MAG: NADP-dependent oxidoreductase [Runella sp.]